MNVSTAWKVGRQITRNYSSHPSQEDIDGGYKLWRRLTFFVAMPFIAIGTVDNMLRIHEPHERAEFLPYPHLRVRTKKFPWGDGNHSLFHNPHMNPLPDGYEE